jgi:hypothetical protein
MERMMHRTNEDSQDTGSADSQDTGSADGKEHEDEENV